MLFPSDWLCPGAELMGGGVPAVGLGGEVGDAGPDVELIAGELVARLGAVDRLEDHSDLLAVAGGDRVEDCRVFNAT